jgi:citrate lyase subunit beta/citryl-CoA lyase
MSCLLFAPASDPKKMEKALNFECSGVILDLEDAVATSEKLRAREYAASFLAKNREKTQKRIYVRINDITTSLWKEDIKALVPFAPYAIVVPKVESKNDVDILDNALTNLEHEFDISIGSTKLMIILESAKGIVNMDSILSNKRIISATIGMADLCKDLNVSWELAFAIDTIPIFVAERTKLSLVSKAFGLEPPWDCVYMNISDTKGLRQDTLIGKRLGCQGKIIIHPNQADIVSEIYSITESEMQQAMRIISLYESAELKGKGAIQVDGFLIDEPVVARARKIISTIKGSKGE